ncbi:MAG: hypothetical protein FWC89_11795, partial [Defluviitaleaceae bacterium]|nr:hypothetical protein [Defluviitaleaceae bacterium]
GFLVGGLSFTILADYYLVLTQQHLYGIATFCFVQVCYMMRALRGSDTGEAVSPESSRSTFSAETVTYSPHENSVNLQDCCWADMSLFYRKKYKQKILTGVLLCAFVSVWAICVFVIGEVVAIAALYACLFITNIVINVKTRARRPKWNFRVTMAGLVLFALCDINVMLYNMPAYLGTPHWFYFVFPLIWIFYLPSQALLAISATSSPRAKA